MGFHNPSLEKLQLAGAVYGELGLVSRDGKDECLKFRDYLTFVAGVLWYRWLFNISIFSLTRYCSGSVTPRYFGTNPFATFSLHLSLPGL